MTKLSSKYYSLFEIMAAAILVDFAKRRLVQLGYRKIQVTDIEGLREILDERKFCSLT